jgi:hypothetical protein
MSEAHKRKLREAAIRRAMESEAAAAAGESTTEHGAVPAVAERTRRPMSVAHKRKLREAAIRRAESKAAPQQAMHA